MFHINSRVKVITFDVYENQVQFNHVEGLILNYIDNIGSYNILLDKPLTFYGHIPIAPNYLLNSIQINADKSVTLNVICSKANMLSYPEQTLRNKLRELGSDLVFSRVNTVITKPSNTIDYVNYYRNDGKIITLSNKDEIDKCPAERLAYKVPHFFGFTKKTNNNIQNTSIKDAKEIHFSANRYTQIDLWDGFNWEVKDKDVKPYLAQLKDQICGVINTNKSADKAISFTKWFICSQQFKTLWMLLKFDKWPEKFLNYTDKQIIDLLIIPENKENLNIRHEVPFSRYLYAAIFLMAVRNVEILPQEWHLPKRKLPNNTEMLPFEKWWPQLVLNSTKS